MYLTIHSKCYLCSGGKFKLEFNQLFFSFWLEFKKSFVVTDEAVIFEVPDTVFVAFLNH
jgi:hypothetical protein